MGAQDRYRFDLVASGDGVKGTPLEEVYKKIGERYRGVNDSVSAMRFTADDVKTFRDSQWSHVKSGMASDGEYQSMGDVKKRMTVSLENMQSQLGRGRPNGETMDSFFNEVSGIGTGADPGSWNAASTPVSISPQEATAYYSNGGIAATVIDKKSKGIFNSGYQFAGQDWDEKECDQLQKYADSVNFEPAAKDWWRDGYIYGGALLVPHLKGDSPMTYLMDERELARQGMLGKGCLDRFWEADRWNSVLIPDWNISAADYLTPKEFLIPITGLSVSTSRMSVGRPKRLPYWGTIRQMGWGISDFPSFMPSLLAYEMAIRSIPIISQQLSLLYLQAPLDAIISQAGLNQAKGIQKQNEEAMRNWSMLNPKMLNLFGDIKSIERHFTDFDDLILLLKEDVGAKAEFSHTILFNELQNGMDEKNYDITLKQTETVKKSAKEAGLQLKTALRFLVYGCFGYDSPQAKKADKLRIEFDTPAIPTNEENNETLTTVANAINGFIQAGFQLEDAVALCQQFIPRLEVSDELRTRIKAIAETEQSVEEAGKRAGLFDGALKFFRGKR